MHLILWTDVSIGELQAHLCQALTIPLYRHPAAFLAVISICLLTALMEALPWGRSRCAPANLQPSGFRHGKHLTILG